ncbi:unnamed protein product [Cylicocyclus nassatus]|uniref:Protein sleepless n=1 Tax=Cylicocyclus nassatus TaxID=53992 RepID=A0AA36DLG5_CYLNA|nr:unnamed protein product [Cylicocyclus nassatus]
MIQRLSVLSLSITLCYGLNCYQCGVFLSAPTSECQGSPKNMSCDPDNYGCLSIRGSNKDGTYYVEKRCAEKTDTRTVGCTDIEVQGISAKQCFCEGDLCNSIGQTFLYTSIVAALVSLLLVAERV